MAKTHRKRPVFVSFPFPSPGSPNDQFYDQFLRDFRDRTGIVGIEGNAYVRRLTILIEGVRYETYVLADDAGIATGYYNGNDFVFFHRLGTRKDLDALPQVFTPQDCGFELLEC